MTGSTQAVRQRVLCDLSLSTHVQCWELFVMLDLNVLILHQIPTRQCSFTGLHVGSCVEPDIEVQSPHRRTLRKESRKPSSLNLRDYNLS